MSTAPLIQASSSSTGTSSRPASFSLPPRSLAALCNSVGLRFIISVVAVELYRFPARRLRLSEGDPAALAQGDLVAMQRDLVLALHGHEGAVGALVGDHEVVVAPLDGAVVARGVLVVDHQA